MQLIVLLSVQHVLILLRTQTLMREWLSGKFKLSQLETFSTKVFMLTTNHKQQFQVRRLELDVCDLYRFSYKNMKEFFHL